LDKSLDSKGNLTLFKLLNDLVQGIQLALGNVNNLVVTYDEELNRIDIIDKSRYTVKRSKENPYSVYLGGVLTGSFGSFVKKAELQSEVPNSLQQLAAIGATNNFSNKEDVTLFSLMNSGSEDRIIGKLKEKNTPDELKDDNPNVNVDLWAKYVNDSYGTSFSFSDDFKVPFRRLNIDVQTAIKQLLTLSTAKNPSKFIPFNLKLELQGLSGFKLLQELNVADGGGNIIPFYLKKNFSFILKEVNDQVTDTGWTTTLGTFVISVDRDGTGVYGTDTYKRAFQNVTGTPAKTTSTKGTNEVFQNNIKRFICSFYYDPNYQWNEIQLAGVMGVIMFESGFNSQIQNLQGSSAYGVCQWLGTRRFGVAKQKQLSYKSINPVNLEDFASTFQPRATAWPTSDINQPGFLIAPAGRVTGIYSDYDIQLLFIKKELETGYKAAKNAVKSATTLEAAVKAWLELYEGIPQFVKGKPNPHWIKQAYLPERIAFANDFLQRMDSFSGPKTLSPSSTNITQFKNKSFYSAY
jgi:hypothetical protein